MSGSSKILAVIALLCASALSPAAQSPPSHDAPYTFKSSVNVVLVPVLVRDKQGNAVGTLEKEDFQIFDNDKPQLISGFTIQKRAPSPSPPSPAPPPAVAAAVSH